MLLETISLTSIPLSWLSELILGELRVPNLDSRQATSCQSMYITMYNVYIFMYIYKWNEIKAKTVTVTYPHRNSHFEKHVPPKVFASENIDKSPIIRPKLVIAYRPGILAERIWYPTVMVVVSISPYSSWFNGRLGWFSAARLYLRPQAYAAETLKMRPAFQSSLYNVVK